MKTMKAKQWGTIADYESRAAKIIFDQLVDNHDSMMTDEALLEAEFDNHDCHASPEDGCTVCDQRYV